MVGAVQPVARLGDVELFGHVLQLAVAVGGARHAVERMIGDVELHDAAPELRSASGSRCDLDAVGDERRARRRIARGGLRFPRGTGGTSRTPSACRSRTASGIWRPTDAAARMIDVPSGTVTGDAVDLERDRPRAVDSRRPLVDVINGIHVLCLRPGFREILPEMLERALDGIRRHAAKPAQRAVDHGIAQFLEQREVGSRSGPFSTRSMTSTPRVDPMRHGVHLPHDSMAQNSIA